jgi:guanosine-3',5'-bis(diphosphate) 3'-pyrophosphohydrolase
MTDLVDMAISFATKCHDGQLRKGGAGIPYITHPLDVMDRLKRHGVDDEVTLAAAVLHDVVEDCGITVAFLIELFGVDVGATVAEVTDPPNVSKNKAKRLQIAKAPTMSLKAKLIKLADKTSNVHDIVENPPGWTAESIQGYTRSASDLVDVLGLTDPAYQGLMADFRAAASRALETA